jgi:acetyl esterase/lipase
VLFAPFIAWRPDVRRVRNVRYGDRGRGNLLDVYVKRNGPHHAPVLIYLHGGGFRIGSKLLGARPLLYRLASQGWMCVSANYPLGRQAAYAERVVDVKRVIAWVRTNAATYGADASTVFLAGGSAGAHLAATAALTSSDEQLQPGFEHVDTSVSAVIAMYGYYGPTESGSAFPSSPLAHLHADAPPFFLIHGALDTLVLVEDAREFASRLRDASSGPVVYAELPGTQHNFDFFHSLRFHAVIEAIESFTDQVRGAEARQAGEARNAGWLGEARRGHADLHRRSTISSIRP